MPQFHISCTFLSLCSKTRNSYCKQVAGINWFKNEKKQSFTHEIYFLAFISSETRVQLLQAQDRRKVGFQHQIMKNQKPGPVRGHGILTEQMA